LFSVFVVYTLLSSNTPALTHAPNTDTIDSPVLKANVTKSPLIIAAHNKAIDVIMIANIKINSAFICGMYLLVKTHKRKGMHQYSTPPGVSSI